jgi:hypothetical protein
MWKKNRITFGEPHLEIWRIKVKNGRPRWKKYEPVGYTDQCGCTGLDNVRNGKSNPISG